MHIKRSERYTMQVGDIHIAVVCRNSEYYHIVTDLRTGKKAEYLADGSLFMTDIKDKNRMQHAEEVFRRNLLLLNGFAFEMQAEKVKRKAYMKTAVIAVISWIITIKAASGTKFYRK